MKTGVALEKFLEFKLLFLSAVFASHGSIRSSLAEGLIHGSFSKIFLSKVFTSGDNEGGIKYMPLCIFEYNSFVCGALKGKVPVISTYNKTPAAHISVGGPKVSLFEIISGAI